MFDELTKEFISCMLKFKKEGPKQMGDFVKGEAHVLMVLKQNPSGLAPVELSNEMNVSSARVAAALNSLESKGMILRRKNPNNKRQTIVEITQKGIDVANEHKEYLYQHIKKMLMSIGEEDANEYVRITKKIMQMNNR